MNEKLLKMAAALGIDTKGKTVNQLREEINKSWGQEQKTIESQSQQELIENGAKKFPEIKKLFEVPFEIWVEKLGQGKKPECLPVVGYIAKENKVIVYKGVKTYQVEENLIITSKKRLDEVITEIKVKRAEKTEGKITKPKK